MISSRIIFALAFALTFAQQAAHATLQPIIEVTADMYPGELYHIGVDVDADQNVNYFYFENEVGKVTPYDLEGLKTGMTILKRDDRDVIKMKATYNAATRTTPVTFTYLYNGIRGTTQKVTANLLFNEHTQRYQFVRVDEPSHVISRAEIVARYLFKTVIGIRSIDFD